MIIKMLGDHQGCSGRAVEIYKKDHLYYTSGGTNYIGHTLACEFLKRKQAEENMPIVLTFDEFCAALVKRTKAYLKYLEWKVTYD